VEKSALSRARTVNIGLEQLDLWGQEKQLIASMTGGGDKLLTAKGQDLITLHATIDGMDGSVSGDLKGKGFVDMSNDTLSKVG
jgi:hypothetical protein